MRRGVRLPRPPQVPSMAANSSLQEDTDDTIQRQHGKAVTAPPAQGDRRDRGRPCGADLPADGSALAAYPERPIKIVVANTPGGPSDISARMMAGWMQQVMGGSVFVENQRRRRRQHRLRLRRARRARRLHHPAHHQRLLRQSEPLPHDPVRPVQGFRADLRAGGRHSRVRGEGRPAGQQHERVRRAGEEEPGEVQRLDAADRHHAAASVRGAEARRGPPGHGERGVQRRRRRGQGGAVQHRADELRLAGAGAAADPGRPAQGAGADRHEALCRRCRTSRPWSSRATRTSCSTPIAR